MRKISYAYLFILFLCLFSIVHFILLIVDEGLSYPLFIFTLMSIIIFAIFLSVTIMDFRDYRKEDKQKRMTSKKLFNISITISVIFTLILISTEILHEEEEFPEYLHRYDLANDCKEKISLFEAIDLLEEHIDYIYPNSEIYDFKSINYNQDNKIIDDGRSVLWELSLQRNVSGKTFHLSIIIGEKGWCGGREMEERYSQPWNFSEAAYDTTIIMDVMNSNLELKQYIQNNPSIEWFVSSYLAEYSPFDDPSYIFVASGGLSERVIISAISGESVLIFF